MSVHLSSEDGLRILQDIGSRKVEGHIEILYNGEWWLLSRTDLKDDVCTWVHGENVDFYRIKLGSGYGVRLSDNGKRKIFAVIDSFSDG